MKKEEYNSPTQLIGGPDKKDIHASAWCTKADDGTGNFFVMWICDS
jgi:hypothetical protein